jgi:phenylalanyl-tRNA synthetase beta chain
MPYFWHSYFKKMKISYSWLKSYIAITNTPEELAEMLTDCGLEVESIEKHQSIKGGLEGIVIGEVKTKEKHPDADRLSVTTVDIGNNTILNIVCGAANVAAGQKVAVAKIGTKLYPTTGEPFEIKKSKIRGAISEGMICAEDEIGLGTSHDGILILDNNAEIGTNASEYFKLGDDYVFEIGLTPNRADAASHIGIARDLAAVINCKNKNSDCKITIPDTKLNATAQSANAIAVEVADAIACPRYSGITISNIKVSASPDWLKKRLEAIGVRCINNIVDITNYVLHEMGQPLHAFDANKIAGKKIIVKKLPTGTKFKTLDEIERTLTENDLMICDENVGLCIAGVFGGINSGVSDSTTSIFLESAYFDAVHVRKTAKHHALKTDASFRFERGTDPNITVTALKRAAQLIIEVAGGEIVSEIIDVYPTKIEPFKVPLSFANCDALIGKKIDHEIIKNILRSLEIEIVNEGNDALLLAVPPFKVDVQREADVIEEILRVYGYNNIEFPDKLHSSLSYSAKPDADYERKKISGSLAANGFYEIFCNSLTKAAYYDNGSSVKLLNPLSNDLNVMRQNLLFSGLEVIAYNQNRKNSDLKLFEFGTTYLQVAAAEKIKYIEEKKLSLLCTGNLNTEIWHQKTANADFYYLKSVLQLVLTNLGFSNLKQNSISHPLFSQASEISVNKKTIAVLGKANKKTTKQFDIKNDVFAAEINWTTILQLLKTKQTIYKEIGKFPEVRRDLALLVDKAVNYDQLEQVAYQAEKKILKTVNLFDVYEGDKIEGSKKSYAMSFILQDETATLTDKQIESAMERISKSLSEKTGAIIRQ